MEDKNKIMGCTPDGKLQVTSEIFNYEYLEVFGKLTEKLNMKEQLQIRLKYAEHCIDEGMEAIAITCYMNILEEVIIDKKIKRGYEDVAKKAYYGLVACRTATMILHGKAVKDTPMRIGTCSRIYKTA